MRIVITALSLAFLVGSTAAFAQTQPGNSMPSTPGALSTSQPQLPSAVTPTGSDVPNNSASSNAMPVEPIAPPNSAAASTNSPAEPNLKAPPSKGGKVTSYVIKDAPLPSDFVMGKVTAPIIMVEYASLSCPHCAHFSNSVLPELQKKYIDSGEMRYILRQFPLNEPALKGAMLLSCVGEQNKEKYYTFAKVLFDEQSKWAFDTNFIASLETIAEVGGLSKDQFQHCVNNTDREMKVLKAKKLATDELQIPHTPYIFIDGEVYEGDRSLEAMSAFIDKKLEQHSR